LIEPTRIKKIKDQLKSNDENQLLRITDLKEEISILSNELTNKNDTIKNLTTITESQIKGYKLIEAPGAKKPWWKFWKSCKGDSVDLPCTS
jgi:Mg2+ and Co2+ transporter CorA